MAKKEVSLTMHESIPFSVSYHQKEGESFCTVRQEDLEGLYKAYRCSSRLGVILGMTAIVFALGFAYSVVNPQIETIVVQVPENLLGAN